MPRFASNKIAKAFHRGDNAATTTEKGNALEELLAYLFHKIPGVLLHEKNARDAQGSEEIDLVFWNERNSNGLPFLDNVLLFECKNWVAPVNGQSVVYFLNKLQTRHLQFGFLIAANGITGNQDDRTAAFQHIGNALIQSNIKLIVLDRNELCALTHSDQLIRLIQKKITNITLRALL